MARSFGPVVFVLPLVVLSLVVLSVVLGACAGRGAGPAVCPGTSSCGPASAVEPLAEETFGSTLTCPIHISATQAAEGAALPQGVPAGAHGRLDEKRTKRARDDGDAATCCYQWVDPCPAG